MLGGKSAKAHNFSQSLPSSGERKLLESPFAGRMRLPVFLRLWSRGTTTSLNNVVHGLGKDPIRICACVPNPEITLWLQGAS